MIELPEAAVVAQQINDTLQGKQIVSAVAGASPHKFAWYSGDPAEYNERLAGKTIGVANYAGCHIEFTAGDMRLSISAPVRYHAQGVRRPAKHQLLIEFDDGTAITSSAQMWGAFMCFAQSESSGLVDWEAAQARPSPLTEAFDRAYFAALVADATPPLSAKAFLATEQRIPGLGNGVLQDILWTARIHPKHRMADLSDAAVEGMYSAVKDVLAAMVAQGGRDTEKDLFGAPGGYRTVLSRYTVGHPCPACGAVIQKGPYLGGSIYYCPGCQPQ
jgi:formamidopyrimidine-DNA glycosylase